ncbi:MAG: hypothetical protein HYX92_16855 [Chloroflexi bacterium]|nr:hypothetical protein [Chloroflexota bacterium]
MAKASAYRSRLLEEVKALSEDRLRALADFAAYLREREEWEATADILGDPEKGGLAPAMRARILKALEKARANPRRGKEALARAGGVA